MAPFILIVVSIYTAMHGYLFWRVWVGFAGLGRLRWVVAAFEVVMIATPFVVGLVDPWRRSSAVRALEHVAYTWLAVIFWFCVLMLAADGWNVVVRLAALAFPSAKAARLPVRAALTAIGPLLAVAVCWGAIEARSVGLERITVVVPNWPADARPLTLVQISDLHLSGRTSPAEVERIAELIRQAEPDVLVCTGDLVDALADTIKPLARPLAEIDPRLGKFAVLGNHEFLHGLTESLAFHKAAGFEVLREASVVLDGRLRLAGVDDPGHRWRGARPLTDEDAALGANPGGVATVLLKHRPTVDERSLGRFRLQLSGHTHGGQIFPFSLLVARRIPYFRGRYELGQGSTLYVSPGVGTWGPPLRLLAPPKVTVITLRPAS